MKRFATIFFVSAFILLIMSENGMSQVRKSSEMLMPTPIAKVYRGPFIKEPEVNVKFSRNEPLAGKKENISYYDSALIAQGLTIDLLAPVGPLVDMNGDPIISNNGAGSAFDYVAYATRFTTTLANPVLDSVKIWFYVDSMENITGNNIQIGAVKQRIVAGTDGVDRPFPDLGTTGAITTDFNKNHKTIARSALKIGTGELNARKVAFSALPLPEQDFIVYINGRVFASQTNIVTNKFRALGDSIDINANGDWDGTFDPEVVRGYRIALDQESAYYTTAFTIFDGRDANGVGGVYEPAMYMIAYVRDPSVAVNDVKLDGNALAQNFPNPFNPTTEIKYSLATGGQTTMKVINALGVEVASLVDGFVGAGEHTATFDGSNLPSGTYFYSLKCGEYSATKRMVLSK